MAFPPIDYENATKAFSPEHFTEAMKDLDRRGHILYGTLRSLCIKYPDHTNLDAVTAKVWIVGRTYATQIERHVRSNKTQGSALSQVADLLLQHHDQIDPLISEIRDDGPPTWDDGDIQSYVRAHGLFVKLLATLTYNKQLPRSFVEQVPALSPGDRSDLRPRGGRHIECATAMEKGVRLHPAR